MRFLAGLMLITSAMVWNVGPAEAREYPGYLRERFEERAGFGRAKRGWKDAVLRRGALRAPVGKTEGALAAGAKLSLKTPVFLVYYLGESPDWDHAQLRSLLFETWPTGSLREAYLEYTYERLGVGGDVSDWLELSEVRSFYEQPGTDAKGRPCTGLCEDKPGGAGPLLKETLEALDAEVDFSTYDNDGPDGIPNSGDDDGFVDIVFFVHNGPGGECGGTFMFSHYYQYSAWFEGVPFETNDPAAGGGKIRIDDYVMQPGMACGNRSMVEVGVFAHEFGHALGLPDLYDTDFSSSGVGTWDLMGRGGFGADGRSPSRPPHLSAWSKAYVGLVDPIELPLCLSGTTVAPLETHPVAYKMSISEDEYFLFECRRKLGFDGRLPGEGLLVWHVDEAVCRERYEDNTVNDDEDRPCVKLIEADNRDDLRLPGASSNAGDPFPGSSGKAEWTCDTQPGSDGYDGSCFGFYITGMGTPGEEGCPIAATQLIRPEAENFVGHVSLAPEIHLEFSRPLQADQETGSLLIFSPEATFSSSLSIDGELLTVSPHLMENTSYEIGSAGSILDECAGAVEPFRVFLDTTEATCAGACCCSMVQCRSKVSDVSWLPVLAWFFWFRVRARKRSWGRWNGTL